MGDNYLSGRPITRDTITTPILHSNRIAGTEVWRVKFFTQSLVTEVRAAVLTAGTANTAGFTILKNATSIGAVLTGTIASGSTADASLADTVFAVGDSLVLKNITADLNMDAVCAIDLQGNYERTD
jgi:hypothetical protein